MNERHRKALSQTPKPYEVGRGKPPKDPQWRPGQSGNPYGRPPGSKNKPAPLSAFAQDCVAVILSESSRKMTVPEADGNVELSLLQINIRRLGLEGAKGRTRAARDFINFAMAASAEESRDRADAIAKALDYKRLWTQDRERCRKMQVPWKAPFPHPDQVHVDVRRMTFNIVGPATKAEVPIWRELATYIPEFEDERREIEAKLADPACRGRRRLEAELDKTNTAISFIESGARFVVDLDEIRKAARRRRRDVGKKSQTHSNRRTTRVVKNGQ